MLKRQKINVTFYGNVYANLRTKLKTAIQVTNVYWNHQQLSIMKVKPTK